VTQFLLTYFKALLDWFYLMLLVVLRGLNALLKEQQVALRLQAIAQRQHLPVGHLVYPALGAAFLDR